MAAIRGGSRTAATSKMDCFVIIVNGWKPFTIITKRSILDGAAVPDPPLAFYFTNHQKRRLVGFLKKYRCFIYVKNCLECDFQKFALK